MNFVSIRDVPCDSSKDACDMTGWKPYFGKIKNSGEIAEFVLWNQDLGEYKLVNTTEEIDDDRDSYDMYS